jgi:hypothetical protein
MDPPVDVAVIVMLLCPAIFARAKRSQLFGCSETPSIARSICALFVGLPLLSTAFCVIRCSASC